MMHFTETGLTIILGGKLMQGIVIFAITTFIMLSEPATNIVKSWNRKQETMKNIEEKIDEMVATWYHENESKFEEKSVDIVDLIYHLTKSVRTTYKEVTHDQH